MDKGVWEGRDDGNLFESGQQWICQNQEQCLCGQIRVDKAGQSDIEYTQVPDLYQQAAPFRVIVRGQNVVRIL